jgi:large subunit ribosomal protein L24
MKIQFSKSWKSSKQPRKQRKYRANLPLHMRKKLSSSHLSKELRTAHGFRSIVARVGDKVKIMRGQFKKKTGTIERINRLKAKAYVTGVEMLKKDGSKVKYPIHTSNLLLTELILDDKKRLKNKNSKISSDKKVESKEIKKVVKKETKQAEKKTEGSK